MGNGWRALCSQAQDDAAPASDLDVLVVLKGDVDPGKEIARRGN